MAARTESPLLVGYSAWGPLIRACLEGGTQMAGTIYYQGVFLVDGKEVSGIYSNDVPSHLNLPHELHTKPGKSEKFQVAALLPLGNLPSFHITCLHRSNREAIEWQRLQNFLHQRQKVAAILVNNEWELFINPPAVTPSKQTLSATVSFRRANSYLAPSRVPHWSPTRVVPTAPLTNHKGFAIPYHLQPNGTPIPLPRQELPRQESTVNLPEASSPGRTSANDQGGSAPVGPRVATLHPSVLFTNSQQHTAWVLGGLAELVDNSRDAKADRLEIFVEETVLPGTTEKIPQLVVADNGVGMSHEELVVMLSWGHEQRADDAHDRVGKFGVGFKTGAMALGEDAVVFTKTTKTCSVGFLSTSYNKGKNALEIPIFTLNTTTMEPEESVNSGLVYHRNYDAVSKFSPFNQYKIGAEMNKIAKTGTRVYIYNLTRDRNVYKLEWTDSKHELPNDILLRSRRARLRFGQTATNVPLDYSLREYLRYLFLEPRMNIFVQGKRVTTKRLNDSLQMTKRVKGSVNQKPIELTLGFSKKEKEQALCGVFLYWRGRLIEAYKRVGMQVHSRSADVGLGVLGVCDVTKVMEEEQGGGVLNNKQGFKDSMTFTELAEGNASWLGKQMNDYWDNNFDDTRAELDKAKPDRNWVQCSKCLKWRILPENSPTADELPDNWFCYMNPDKTHNNCQTPQEQPEDGQYDVVVNVTRNGQPPATGVTKPPAPKVEPKKATPAPGNGSGSKKAELGSAKRPIFLDPPSEQASKKARKQQVVDDDDDDDGTDD